MAIAWFACKCSFYVYIHYSALQTIILARKHSGAQDARALLLECSRRSLVSLCRPSCFGRTQSRFMSVDLADTELTDLGMVHLPKFERLTRLSLFYCNVSNNGLRHLQNMTSLEVLNLDSREVGDDGLAYLRHLKNLKSLDIFSGRITDVGCGHLSKISSLESLELCGGGVGDLGCTLLAQLQNLTSLNLSQNERITNRGAAALAALSNLKALNLSNTRVNAAALRFFSSLVKLQSLALYGCRGIENGNGLAKLQSGLPSLKCLRLNSNASDDGDGLVQLDPDQDSDDEEMSEFHAMRQRSHEDDSMASSDDEDEHDDVSIYSGI